MTHAIVIMAHGEFEILYRLASYFTMNCKLYIHVDKKVKVPDDVERKLRGLEQVTWLGQKYNVHWGGFSILRCELFMLRLVVDTCDADYIHLISGQDYPIRPLKQFLNFFDDKNLDYVQYVHLPHSRWDGNTFSRFQYYYMYDWFADKDRGNRITNRIVDFQKKHGLKRRIPDKFDHLYGNSQWFSITRDSAKYLISFTKNHPLLYRRMWMTFAPEESYISTVLVNRKDYKRVVSNNLRYVRWKYENGNSPANLDLKHFAYLLEGEYFFARKMSQHCSMPLLDMIDKYLIHDDEIFAGDTGAWMYDGVLKYSFEQPFCDLVCQLWWERDLSSAIDFGCGSGHYVAQWRKRGLGFVGYDANPHSGHLSQMLSGKDSEWCREADLTDDLSVDKPFDLLVCKDVLNFIPKKYHSKCYDNMALLSSRFILLSWHTSESVSHLAKTEILEERIEQEMSERGFVKDKYFTSKMRIMLKRTDCCIFKRYSKGKFKLNH